MKKVWRKNFEIPRCDLNISSESAIGFHALQSKTLGRNLVNESIWVFKNLDNIATYFLKHELRGIIEATLAMIKNKPDKIDEVHKKTVSYNKQYFIFSEKIRRLHLKTLNDKQLLAWHKKLFDWQYLSHGYSLPTSWFIDSDGEDFTKYIISFIKSRADMLSVAVELSSVFSKLTTPKLKSYSQAEEIESLKILQKIIKNKKLVKSLLLAKDGALINWLESCPANLQKTIKSHHYRWCWLPYTYLGPAYTLDYYLEVWRGLLREKINPQVEIKKIINQAQKIQQEKANLFKLLKLSHHERHVINIATDIIWLKGYRKDCYFHGFYVLDLLLAEIGRRAGLSLMQVKYLLPQELPKLFSHQLPWADLANQRMKFAVLYHKDKQVQMLAGEQARKFLAKQNFEKIKVPKVSEITGTCACPGSVRGRVCIVNVPADMVKMKKGNIMISHTTYPALVSAMKMASGIVTEDGGITCHAAIVARELQIPCVVGTKIATRILKDGDLIQVDANSGLVKKI